MTAHTILHRQLFSITFPKETTGAFIRFLTQRVPLLMLSLDLYEDFSLLTVAFYWSKMVQNAPTKLDISPEFAARISMATQAKLMLVYLTWGLQISGLLQLWLNPPKEKPSSSKSLKVE